MLLLLCSCALTHERTPTDKEENISRNHENGTFNR